MDGYDVPFPTTKLNTGGFALRTPVTLSTRITWVRMVTSTTATGVVFMSRIPTAGVPLSEHRL